MQITRWPCAEQVLAEVGAEEAGSAGDDAGAHRCREDTCACSHGGGRRATSGADRTAVYRLTLTFALVERFENGVVTVKLGRAASAGTTVVERTL